MIPNPEEADMIEAHDRLMNERIEFETKIVTLSSTIHAVRERINYLGSVPEATTDGVAKATDKLRHSLASLDQARIGLLRVNAAIEQFRFAANIL